MTDAKNIMTIVIFIGFLLFFVTTTALEATALSINNQSDTNLTFLTSSVTTAPVCDFSSDIPFATEFYWGVDCIVGYMNFLMGFAGLGSNVIWLGLILGGIVAAMIYKGIRLIRGGG